jgi:NADH-quinone oxidoreductase subunit I
MEATQTYFTNIRESVVSIFDGLAVTMSHMFRAPSTIQYPYHPRQQDVPLGGPSTLPDRYRGFLEVDMDICTACLMCEKACPIDCINIDIEKVTPPEEPEAKPVRAMVRFDIDMAKCMYCGLCQEPCPTNAIRHTKHFESSVANLEHLVARFVDRSEPVVPFKVKKGIEYVTDAHGAIAQGIYVDTQWDLPPIKFPEIPRSTGKKADVGPVDPFVKPLSDLALSAKSVDQKKLALILEEAMAGTDCGACQYPTCEEYSVAIAKGECSETFRCEPGGADSAIEAEQIVLVHRGEWEKRKAEAEAKKQAVA